MKIKIFFSWQSAEPKYNKYFITECIKGAIKKINKNPNFSNIEFEITDAIRGEAGQIAVADSIIDKIIPSCDVFIADLTVTKISKIIRLLTKPKQTQNLNVMTEYGVALSSIKKERILSVFNLSNSESPKVNSELIPFDIRQDRFPTEFNYSEKNRHRKPEIKKKFIEDLVNALKPIIQDVLETQKSKFRPFIGWNELNDLLNNPRGDRFIESDNYREIKSNIKDSTSTNPVRILGLSGLGKTRIMFEVFRPDNDNNNSLIFSNRLLYVNCNDYQQKINFVEPISKIVKDKKDAILLVDNCDLETHRIISKNINGLKFISIDSNPEESPNTEGTNYVIIAKNDLTNVVAELVDNEFQNVGKENLEKIKDFSQGIPLMAVLLAKSVRNGEKFIGKLGDEELLDNLLGSKGKEKEWRSILKSCSIFSYFGYYDEYKMQYEFIAKNSNITISNNTEEVRLSTILEVVKHFKEREIFEKQGRFLSIRPFPLAMALAVEWLSTCPSERLLKVINEISQLEDPHGKQLITSLSERMKYLGYNDKAIEIVDKIVGSDGPFDNAEVLNTELGSRLFRSFVEVNPVAVSKNLFRVFSNKTTDDLLKIVKGRRNLVWVLEKLCFDKRTFSESIIILLEFAIAENESWSNNASGQFLQLFKINLSGTEADLSERWAIIQWALNKDDKSYYEFAIKAMREGLSFGRFHRMGGAELQGTKRLQDNNPTWQEIQTYWTHILDKLLEFIKSKSEYSELSSVVVTDSIGGVFQAKQGELIMPYLKEISEIKNYDWDDGLTVLRSVMNYDRKLTSKKLLAEVENLIGLLTKVDFLSRFLRITSSYHLDYDETPTVKNKTEAINNLADEFVKTNISWEDTFFSLYKHHQVSTYHFGKRLSELLKNNGAETRKFISFSMEVISQIPREERNFTILAGFIANSSEKIKVEFYGDLFESIEFRCQLFYFISVDHSGANYLDLLFSLVDNEYCKLSRFYAFNYNNFLFQLSHEELNVISEKLFSYGVEGYEIVFSLFYDVGYGDESRQSSLIPIFKKCILELGYNRKFTNDHDDYKWAETIVNIIKEKEQTDFAQFINRSIIDSISWENSYHLDENVQSIYEILIEVHFNSIWKDLSKALVSREKDYIKFLGLKNILGSKIGGVGRNIGVLFDGDMDLIFNWCENNNPLAPSRLAELAPIFNSENSEYKKFHPIANRLIDEYGNQREVLESLDINMGSISWIGSLVPFLEAKKKLFQQLNNHKFSSVRDWAISNIKYLEKSIENEKNRDEERFL